MGTERFNQPKQDSGDMFSPVSNRFTFPSKNRILKRLEFVGLSKRARKLQNRHFILLAADGNEAENRLGITVSKRVGNAVTRNRIKRSCREFFRHYRHRLAGASDFNLIAKKHAAELNSKETVRSLNQLFSKI